MSRAARERDPTFVSDSYAECYPGYSAYNTEIAGSDEEGDDPLAMRGRGGKSKGDQGGTCALQLHLPSHGWAHRVIRPHRWSHLANTREGSFREKTQLSRCVCVCAMLWWKPRSLAAKEL